MKYTSAPVERGERKSLGRPVLLVFNITALLTAVNDHSAGTRFDFGGINNGRGNYQRRNRIMKESSSSFFLIFCLSLPISSSPPLSLSLSSRLQIFEWQSWWYSRPSKPPLSQHPPVSAVNGCQSDLGPHADWQQVSSRSRNNYDRAALEMDSRGDSPHRAPPLSADGVLPWEAIIAGCQLTARFYCQARSALVLGLSLGK